MKKQMGNEISAGVRKMGKGVVGYMAMLLTVITLSFAAPPEGGLVLWFGFEGVPIDNTAKDLSGNNNDGLINGNVKWTADGKYGGGMEFENGSITVANSDSLAFKDTVTIALWMKSDEVPDAYRRLVNCGWIENGSYILGIDNHWSNMALCWDIKSSDGTRYDANGDGLCVPGTWQFVAGTYDGEKLRLYVDGELKTESAASGKINGGFDIEIGWGAEPPGAAPFVGVMDEIRFYNRALSDDEIIQCMETPPAQALNPQDKLTTLWGKVKDRP